MELEYIERNETKRLIRARTIVERRADNEKLDCSVPGCGIKRKDISAYCTKHRDNLRQTGHPTLPAPKASELEDIMREGVKLLDWYRKKDSKLDLWLDAIGKELYQPLSHRVTPWRIDERFKRKSKAKIILAWYQHERGYDLKSLALLFLSVELWAYKLDQQCGPSIRHQYVNRTVGLKVKQLAKIKRTRKVHTVRIEANPSWANEPYKRIEEEKVVTEHGKIERSVNKMLGKLIRDAVYKHISSGIIREYVEEELLAKAMAGATV